MLGQRDPMGARAGGCCGVAALANPSLHAPLGAEEQTPRVAHALRGRARPAAAHCLGRAPARVSGAHLARGAAVPAGRGERDGGMGYPGTWAPFTVAFICGCCTACSGKRCGERSWCRGFGMNGQHPGVCCPRGRAALGLAPLAVGDPWWAGGMAPRGKAELPYPRSSRDWEPQLLAVGDEGDAA